MLFCLKEEKITSLFCVCCLVYLNIVFVSVLKINVNLNEKNDFLCFKNALKIEKFCETDA